MPPMFREGILSGMPKNVSPPEPAEPAAPGPGGMRLGSSAGVMPGPSPPGGRSLLLVPAYSVGVPPVM